MDKLKAVLEILNNQGLNATIENDRYIVWTNSFNVKNSIYIENISIHKEKIAWFQSDKNDSMELFRIFENNIFFDFEPKTSHPGYGCDIYLVEWIDDYLIVIYHEKHNVVISSVKDKNIKTLEFHGDQLIRRGDILYFKEYGLTDSVRVLKIPEIIEMEKISKEKAIENNTVPETLGYGNILSNK